MTHFYDPGVIRDRDGFDPWAEFELRDSLERAAQAPALTEEEVAAMLAAEAEQMREIEEAHAAGLY